MIYTEKYVTRDDLPPGTCQDVCPVCFCPVGVYDYHIGGDPIRDILCISKQCANHLKRVESILMLSADQIPLRETAIRKMMDYSIKMLDEALNNPVKPQLPPFLMENLRQRGDDVSTL